MASTAENEAIVHTSPQILTTTSDSLERAEDQVRDVEMLPVPEASSTELFEDMTTTTTTSPHDAILDQEFVVPFPDPASTLDIHDSARLHQGVQVNHSEAVQPTTISYGGSTLNTSLAINPTMGHNPPKHLFNDPYEYELEKIRIEEDNLKKSLEETTSRLMAELEREMAEARSQFDRESQELDAKVMEVETHMGLVRTGSLLANAFASKCSERSASNDLAAVRAAMISQHSTQQQQTNTQMSSTVLPRVRPQQEVQASTRMSSTSAPPRPSVTPVEAPVPNSSGPLPRRTTTQPSPMSQQTVQAAHTHVSSTAPPRPSVTAVEDPMPNSSGSLPHLPRRPTTQISTMSQQTVQAANTHVNSTAPPPSPPSVTSVEPQTPNHLRPLVRFPRTTTTQPRPISQQAPNTNVNSTALPRPSVTTEALPRPSSVTTEALPMHSPLSNTPRPRPRPVISNLTPSSSPPVHGTGRGPAPHIVRASAPHLARRRAPHLKQYGSSPAPISATAAATTHPSRPVQEQEQQQGKSNGGLVHLSDED
ncbi:hypothetical protein Bca52824_010157 [Brassica carinata]|uniref:Uncharacterized protein n=1 Tax=Brassica carinata TaxID=52824 RepID=A0A8X8B7G1_BRACI|nr:hypothetical protein Bca52824_010157 [Brassica carinata]